MSQPTPYNRGYSFTDFASANPSQPLPGVKVDVELDAIEQTLDQTLANLARLQRDDGALANASVGVQQLSATALALIGQDTFSVRGAWVTATAYLRGDFYADNNQVYLVMADHTSTSIAADIAAEDVVGPVFFPDTAQVAALVTALAQNTGASTIGTSIGSTVEAELATNRDFIAALAESDATPGANLVGAYDFQAGSVWTTVQGYITAILSNLGSSFVGFLQAGTGGAGRTVQGKLRDVVSPEDFGAAGDGTTDDRTALLNALQSGRIVDMNGRTYAISAELAPTSFKTLRNGTLKWSDTTAMAVQQFLLKLVDLSDISVEGVTFDLGTVAAAGSADDSSRGGLKITTSSPNVTFNERVKVKDCTVLGYGNGTRIYVRSCKRVKVSGNTVYGGRVIHTPDPTNDCQNGIDIGQCVDAVVSGNIVTDLQTRLLGVYQKRFSRGILVFETRDSVISGNKVSFVDQGADFSGGWDAVTNTNGNVGLAVTGNQISDVYTYGIKCANVMRDSTVSGNSIRRFGLGGIVLSGSSVVIADNTKNTQRVTVSNNVIADATGEFSANGRGIWIAEQPTSVGYPRGIVVSGNRVSDTLGLSKLIYGYQNEVVYDGSSLLLNEMRDCRSVGHVTAPSTGFAPWRTQLTGNSNQSIPDATPTNILWTDEQIDGPSAHAANDHTITAKIAGLYRVSFVVPFASNATGYRKVNLLKNGGTISGSSFAAAAVNGEITTVAGDMLVSLALNDELRLEVTQNSGGALNINRALGLFTVELVELA